MEFVVLVALLVVIAALVWHLVDVFAAHRLALRKKVLVNLRNGRAFRGVLWTRRGRLLVLKSAELLEPNADPVSLDGDVIVDRAEVEFVQAAS